MSITHLSDSPDAPKLVPQFELEPATIAALVATHSPDLRQVVIESVDSGATSHLVGPFADDSSAQSWADAFVARFDYDSDFIHVSPLWELTAPYDVELDAFYG